MKCGWGGSVQMGIFHYGLEAGSTARRSPKSKSKGKGQKAKVKSKKTGVQKSLLKRSEVTSLQCRVIARPAGILCATFAF
jgi:hypothetical protein